MKDLTEYSDQELSLHVFNDEYLYNITGKQDKAVKLNTFLTNTVIGG